LSVAVKKRLVDPFQRVFFVVLVGWILRENIARHAERTEEDHSKGTNPLPLTLFPAFPVILFRLLMFAGFAKIESLSWVLYSTRS